MKYNTISASSLSSSDCKKSTLTIYTDPDFVKEKISTSDAEIASVRGELEIVQRALKLQTKRCRQLVAEYTRRLQQKEQQYQCERNLRNDQLAKVLRALLIFEARLRQEQKFISHQLSEKDYIIKKQRNDITKLMSNQYCKHCNQYYSPASNLESLDSSSEYVVTTDYQDYQSSNFESLDSSSETYATISEKEYDIKSKTPSSDQSYSGEEHANNSDRDVGKIMIYQKNKLNKDSLNRRGRKLGHRKSVGTYFEVLKMRNESPTSNEDNTSNDYENLDSLPPESITDKISVVSERIENIFAENGQKEKDSSNSSSNGTDSDCNNTVIQNCNAVEFPINFDEDENKINSEKSEEIASKISNLIPPVFDGDGETNDKWYASGSELEDEEQRDIYRNNPVLECMNQILLHNINDATISPPKTPTVSRKFQKNKRVKFSDAEEMESSVNKDDANRENTLSKENLKKEELNEEDKSSTQSNYYETPIQKQPNFYETPQSIYSNDYEQILSKCSESFSSSSGNSPTKLDAMQEKEINMLPTKKLSVIKNIDFESTNRHYYDMDAKVDNENEIKIVRKSKILRIPPALPPKPTNLVSKYKLQNLQSKITIPSAAEPAIESEPDYCSISELNIPTNKNSQKISVVAEINILDGTKDSEKHVVVHKAQISEVDSHYDPVVVNEDIANLVSKNIEKFNMQMNNKLIPSAVKTETSASSKPKPKPDTEIPKLPQVSEIIIPEETEESAQEEERISQDNYIKNNSQILLKIKGNTNKSESLRRPIVIGKSVSSLITGFNNHQLLSEIHQQPPTLEKPKTKITFPGFEANSSARKAEQQVPISPQKTPSFEKFDLSQNFEEFKLEDCQIGEEYDIDNSSDVTEKSVTRSEMEEHKMPDLLKSPTKCLNSTRVELVRATNNVTIPQLSMSAIQQFRKKLELQKSADDNDAIYKNNAQIKCQNEPTYEHFLECTGLSSKSILTPSRLLSNHKSVLKPKDVKLRSKVRSNNVFERQGSTIKYWSEPYI